MSTYISEGPIELFGNAVNQATVKELSCYDQSSNQGITDLATFKDASSNDGTIVVAAGFQDNSENTGTLQTFAYFDGEASNTSITPQPATIFFTGSSVNSGPVDTAVFAENSENQSAASSATFADSSTNSGVVTDAKFVSVNATNTGQITNSVAKPAGLELTGVDQAATTTTFVQATGAHSYGYFRYGVNGGDEPAPNEIRGRQPLTGYWSLMAFEALDLPGTWYQYDYPFGKSTAANGFWLIPNGDIQNPTDIYRYFSNGIILDVAGVYLFTVNSFYFYKYSLGSNNADIYTNVNLTSKPEVDNVFGRDQIVTNIDNTDANFLDCWWSIKNGVFTWTLASSSVVLGGNKYYFANGSDWYDGSTTLYTNAAKTTLATAAMGAYNSSYGKYGTYSYELTESLVYEWIIDSSGTATRTLLSSIELTNGDINAGKVTYYHTGVTFETGSRVYDVTGKPVASLQGVVDEYNFSTDEWSLTRHSITNGVATVNPLNPDSTISGETENYYHSIGNFATGVTLYNTNGSIAANKSGTHNGLTWSSNASGIVTVNS